MANPLPPADRLSPAPQETTQLLYHFDRAWQTGTPPRIEDFLPPASASAPETRGPHRRLLVELVLVDLEYRWRLAARTDRGVPPVERLRLEDYLKRYPGLGRASELDLELVAQEYEVRHCWGDRPAHGDYLARFPQFQEALRPALARVDAKIANEYGSTPVTPEPASSSPGAVTVASLMDTLRQLQFLRAPQLEELQRELRGQANTPRDLAKELLRRNWLTPYQVNQLLQGRGAELLIGPYVILERLGAGGAGNVFKARHKHLKRIVALKQIRKELVTDVEMVGRFQREIQAISRLSHPHVVHAVDAGPIGYSYFLAMEYVEGIDLSRLVERDGPLPVDQACEYLRQAALGFQYIHEMGLVHRDIKPSNLLVSGLSKSAPAGRHSWGTVRILDLGLARLHASGGETGGALTASGAVMMGTLDFMAPEQALDFHRADIRSDIYSMGCTLYYLLTGQPPYGEGAPAQKLLAHQMKEPRPLETFRRDVPAPVQAILRQMMAKSPEKRYQTPAELGVTLAALATGRTSPTHIVSAANLHAPGGGPPQAIPVEAHGLAARLREFRTRRWVVGGGIAVLAAPVLVFTLARWVGRRPASLPGAVSGDDLALSGGLDGLVAVFGDGRIRQWGTGTGCALSPDGKQLVTTGGESKARLWDATTGLPLRTFDGLLGLPQFGPGTELLAGAGDGNSWRLWNLKTNKEAPLPPGRILGFAPDLSHAAYVSADGTEVQFYELAAGKNKGKVTGKGLGCVGFSPDGQLAAIAGGQAVIVAETGTGHVRARLTVTATSPVRSVALAAGGKTLAYMAVSWKPEEVRWCDVQSTKDLQGLHGTSAWALAPDGRTFAARRPDGFGLRDATSGKDRATLRVQGRDGAVAFSPDGRIVATGALDAKQSLKLWDVATGDERPSPSVEMEDITALTFSADGKTLASVTDFGRFKLWDVSTGRDRLGTYDWPDWFIDASYSPDGKPLALVGRDRVRLWDPKTGQARSIQLDEQRKLSTALFAANGQTLAIAAADAVRLWDVPTGKLQATMPMGALALAFAPDGKTLATAGGKSVKLWQTDTGKSLASIPDGPADVCSLAFSPKGNLLAWSRVDGTFSVCDPSSPLPRTHGGPPGKAHVGFASDGLLFVRSGDGTIKFWDVARTKEPTPLPTASSVVWAVSPTGRAVVTSGRDNILRVWDVASGKNTGSLERHKSPVNLLAFAADGQKLASAGLDGRVVVRDASQPMRFLGEWQFPGPVHKLVFSPDGWQLLTVNANGTVYLLRCPS